MESEVVQMSRRSKLAREYLNIVFRYTVALIIAMFIKVSIIDMIPSNEEQNRIVFNEEKNEEKAFKLEYTIKTVEDDISSFKIPVFVDENLNNYVDDYILSNNCHNLEYRITELGKDRANIFLNCGSPSNKIYEYRNKKELEMKDLFFDYDQFLNNSKRLINLKYPKFVTEDIIWEKAVYEIKPNEITGYYKTKEFKDATYTINNNEIENLANYDMHYDDAYENEKFELDPNKKAIAFTFDDGPSTYDLYIIDALVASHSTATFYMVGNRMRSFPLSIDKMIKTGMEVGNHTYDHKSLTSLSDAEVKNQITKTNDLFYEMTGHKLTSLRPSYGNINNRVRVQVGMPVILWNIDTLDWKTRNAEKIYNSIINNAKDGDIVLMHSLYESTQKAVEKVLPELYKRGFQVVSVGELAKLKNYDLANGSTVWNIN